MNVHVPLHLKADWVTSELSRRIEARKRGTKTTYIKPKRISIHQHLALAEKLKKP